jgi:hypothetical protein
MTRGNGLPAEGLTKEGRKRALEAKAWKVLCTKCGARPGEGCVTPNGERTGLHAVRIRQSAYLPVLP